MQSTRQEHDLDFEKGWSIYCVCIAIHAETTHLMCAVAAISPAYARPSASPTITGVGTLTSSSTVQNALLADRDTNMSRAEARHSAALLRSRLV